MAKDRQSESRNAAESVWGLISIIAILFLFAAGTRAFLLAGSAAAKDEFTGAGLLLIAAAAAFGVVVIGLLRR